MRNNIENLENFQNSTENSEMPKDTKDNENLPFRIENYNNNYKPTSLTISQSIVAQKLVEIDKEREKKLYAGMLKKRNEPVYVKVLMDKENMKNKDFSIIGQNLTEFDKMVHDAIVSYFVAGNTCFTLQDIYRLCNGQNIKNIKNYTLKEYQNSIEKLTYRKIEINATEQIEKMYNQYNIKEAIYKANLMPIIEIKIKMSSGEIINGYAFQATPPIYQYSSNIKQIVNVDVQLLTEERFKNNKEVAVFNYYLVRRIEIMKSDKNETRKILYQTLFEKTLNINFEELDKKQKTRYRKRITNRLEYYKQRNYIVDYKEYEEKRKIVGVEIILKKEENNKLLDL